MESTELGKGQAGKCIIEDAPEYGELNPLSSFIESGMSALDSQLKFVAEIDKMTHILRRTLLVDGSRRENDAEHSWHIAVMCLLFRDYFSDKSCPDKKPDAAYAAKLCLVHDLVEIYAGDTFAFDKEANKSKIERENQAADRLFSQLPEAQGKEIRSLWQEFDAMETIESKYANCMDRIQPFLHNTLTGGHTWLQGSATVADVVNRGKPVKEYMPEIWKWMEINIEAGVKKGWIQRS